MASSQHVDYRATGVKTPRISSVEGLIIRVSGQQLQNRDGVQTDSHRGGLVLQTYQDIRQMKDFELQLHFRLKQKETGLADRVKIREGFS